MSSPFSNYANTVLTFQLPTGLMTADDNGNPIPQVEAVEVTALLQRDLRRDPQGLPGIDQDRSLLKGWLVNPLMLPPGVAAGVIADCAITESPEQTNVGKFEILDALQNPFVMGVGIRFLTRVRGIFRPGR